MVEGLDDFRKACSARLSLNEHVRLLLHLPVQLVACSGWLDRLRHQGQCTVSPWWTGVCRTPCCLWIHQPATVSSGKTMQVRQAVLYAVSCRDTNAVCGLCRPATVISLVVAAGVTSMMWKRYQRTQKIFPAGFTAVLSLAMVCFYVWNLLLFKPPNKRS